MRDEHIHQPRRGTFEGYRFSAVTEMALLMAALLAIDWLFFDGGRFRDVSPHPFWIVVLLITVQYGTKEGISAAFTSGLALWGFALPEQHMDQDVYAYIWMLLRLPFLWFTTAVVLGEIRMRHIEERDKLRTALTAAEEKQNIVAQAYQDLSKKRELLETQVAAQMRTFHTMYVASKAVAKLEPDAVIAGAGELVRTVLDPEQFSLFLLRRNRLEVVLHEGWRSEDNYSRVLTPDHRLFCEVVGAQRFLSGVDGGDAHILSHEGVLAGPLMDPSAGRMLGMLKIERIAFLNLTSTTFDYFRSCCNWISEAYAKAERHQELESDSILHRPTELFSYGFYSRQRVYLAHLAKRLGFDLSQVEVRLANADELSAELKERFGRALLVTVQGAFRKTDMPFYSHRRGSSFAVLLPGTPMEKAEVVSARLRTHLEQELGREKPIFDVTYSTSSVFSYDPPRSFNEFLIPEQLEFLAELARRLNFELMEIVVGVANASSISIHERVLIRHAILEPLGFRTESGKPVFAAQTSDMCFHILLPGRSHPEAERFATEVLAQATAYLDDQRARAKLVFTVRAVHSCYETSVVGKDD